MSSYLTVPRPSLVTCRRVFTKECAPIVLVIPSTFSRENILRELSVIFIIAFKKVA